MDFSINRVKGFNFLLVFLVSIQLVLIVMTAMFFLFSSIKSQIPITSIFSVSLLLLFCIPICILLYKNSNVKASKVIFLGFAVTLTGFFLSGIIWYILPNNVSSSVLVPIGMLIMVADYLPLIIALIIVLVDQRKQLNPIIQLFIFSLTGTFILFLLYCIATNIYPNIENNIFYIVIYTISVCGDIILLSLVSTLILINMPTQLRYLLFIVFGMSLFSFIGDQLQLLSYLNLYDTAGYSDYFYAIMLMFISVTLLIYSFSNIKVKSVEEVNKELKDSSIVIDDLIKQSPDSMCMCNPDGIIQKANDQFIKTFNISDPTNINILNYKFNFENDLTSVFRNVLNGESIHLENIKLLTDNNYKYLTIKLFPTYTSDGNISRYIFVAEDVTLRKNAEDELVKVNDLLEARVRDRTSELLQLNETLQKEIQERKKDEEKITNSLKEKEVLLKEIHHRVKNNMQIISSMLGLQSSYINDIKFAEMLKDSQNRIKSMALIHERLYQSDNLASVNLKEYIQLLIAYLQGSFHNVNIDRIKVNLNIDNISMNIDTAIPLGLIINELISNAFKHAFPNGREGNIDLSIISQTDKKCILKIKDDGVGLPVSFNKNNAKTLGINLVYALVGQINGEIDITNENGACFTIIFQYK